MAPADLILQPVRELADRLRAGSTSSAELLEQLLARIDETEPSVKAYTTVRVDDARRDAERADQELETGQDRGPLHGLPVSIKDLIDTNGVRTTYGSPIYEHHVPSDDATVVRRVKDAGAVIVGKTNTHEFALGGITPPTRNPFDLDRIAGGSSGGSAAAIAAGSALLTLGTDTGGSIRIPASYCGAVGLKPTYGLVSRAGVFPESWSLDHVGPMTRYVEDAAVLLGVIAGHDPLDPTSARVEVPNYVDGLDGQLDGLSVGVPTNYFFDHLDAEVGAALSAAIEQLAKAGATLEEVDIPNLDEILAAHTAIDLAEIATNHRRLYVDHSDKYLPETKPFIELGFFVRATTYIDALRARPRLLTEVLETMKSVDVLAVPTEPIVAPKVGEEVLVIDGYEEDVLSAMIRFTAFFNLTGMPALSLCCGYNGRGLPIGLQIVGKPLDEVTVLRVAHAYETSAGWREHQLTPPSARD
jgi:aspartyl-tRNA(Asn)/glutamyl-tRNA(Gln) amidotransferase subunit A